MICDKCGRKNSDDTVSCENCGSPLDTAAKPEYDNLPGFLKSEWLGFTQVVPRFLYLGAVIALVIALFVSIHAAIAYHASLASKTQSFLVILGGEGLFFAGILAGLAAVVSIHKDPEHARRQRKVLYIAAGTLLAIGIALAALHMFTGTDTLTYSLTYKAYLTLRDFLTYGLFYSCVLAGLAALNSPHPKSEEQIDNPVINILYLAAAVTLVLAIIVASLYVCSSLADGETTIQKTTVFLTYFASYGITYGGILAALGKLVSLRTRKKESSVSTDEECEKEKVTAGDGPATT